MSVVIQANDYVAGVIGFTSSSYIAKEGQCMRYIVLLNTLYEGCVSNKAFNKNFT